MKYCASYKMSRGQVSKEQIKEGRGLTPGGPHMEAELLKT